MLDPCTRPDFSTSDTFSFKEKPDDFEYYREVAKASPLKVIGFDWMFEPSYEWSGCHLSWTGPFIQPNGDMYPCYKYDYILGNVFTENPLRIWNNEKARAFRKALRTQDPPLNQCHSCNFARPKWQPGGAYNREKRDTE
jgi:radical SAM protein with 4Fe4S-binding SPASM domain